MKRVCICILIGIWMLGGMMTVSAEAPATTTMSVVEETAEFPSAVDDILLREANIKESERIPVGQLMLVIDSCEEALAGEEATLVPVESSTVIKVPVLKACATVECTSEFVYATSFKRGVKYEWIYYTDGRVKKTVSYDYEERTMRFETYTYSIVNNNNESMTKVRIKAEQEDVGIDTSDMLFGMAIAVVLCMAVTVVMRAIRSKKS